MTDLLAAAGDTGDVRPWPGAPARPVRARRSNLAVPGSSRKMIDKARSLPVDQVFLDLEDSVAPIAKADARKHDRGRAQRGRLGRPGRASSG